MELLLVNYKLIIGMIILIVILVFSLYKFIAQPSSKQKEQIRAILLGLVIESEKLFGSKTGKLKFSYVYSELVIKLPYLRYIPIAVIETLIEESLQEMRHLLETNSKVAEIVNNKEGEK